MNDKTTGRKLANAWADHVLPAKCDVRSFAAGKTWKSTQWEKKLELEKSVTFSKTGQTLRFTQRLRNRTSKPFSFRYGTEMTWKLKDAQVNRIGETPALKHFSIVDPLLRLRISWSFSRPARLMYFPRETEMPVPGNRRERVYQGVSLTPVWNVSLPARGRWSVRWTLSLGEPDAGA